MAVGHYAWKAKKGAVKLFELCLHPRRYEAENLLQQGMSIRRSAKEVGIGQAALHRHWRRHVANRNTISAADSVKSENETAVLARPEKVPNAVWSSYRLSTVTHPAGGGPFCWCAKCCGRRCHYAD
jgi:hypothetical protein